MTTLQGIRVSRANQHTIAVHMFKKTVTMHNNTRGIRLWMVPVSKSVASNSVTCNKTGRTRHATQLAEELKAARWSMDTYVWVET